MVFFNTMNVECFAFVCSQNSLQQKSVMEYCMLARYKYVGQVEK